MDNKMQVNLTMPNTVTTVRKLLITINTLYPPAHYILMSFVLCLLWLLLLYFFVLKIKCAVWSLTAKQALIYLSDFLTRRPERQERRESSENMQWDMLKIERYAEHDADTNSKIVEESFKLHLVYYCWVFPMYKLWNTPTPTPTFNSPGYKLKGLPVRTAYLIKVIVNLHTWQGCCLMGLLINMMASSKVFELTGL